MTNETAFTTSFTGTSLRKATAHHTASKTPCRSSKSITPVSVAVGGRTARAPATGWGVSSPPKTYEVTVVQKNKSVVIEVDGGTDLRTAMLSNGVDVYTLGGKFRNCGGGGQCGTCLISVEDNAYNAGARTAREEFLLSKKPDSYRLACRTTVTGPVTVRTKPQA